MPEFILPTLKGLDKDFSEKLIKTACEETRVGQRGPDCYYLGIVWLGACAYEIKKMMPMINEDLLIEKTIHDFLQVHPDLAIKQGSDKPAVTVGKVHDLGHDGMALVEMPSPTPQPTYTPPPMDWSKVTTGLDGTDLDITPEMIEEAKTDEAGLRNRLFYSNYWRDVTEGQASNMDINNLDLKGWNIFQGFFKEHWMCHLWDTRTDVEAWEEYKERTAENGERFPMTWDEFCDGLYEDRDPDGEDDELPENVDDLEDIDETWVNPNWVGKKLPKTVAQRYYVAPDEVWGFLSCWFLRVVYDSATGEIIWCTSHQD